MHVVAYLIIWHILGSRHESLPCCIDCLIVIIFAVRAVRREYRRIETVCAQRVGLTVTAKQVVRLAAGIAVESEDVAELSHLNQSVVVLIVAEYRSHRCW